MNFNSPLKAKLFNPVRAISRANLFWNKRKGRLEILLFVKRPWSIVGVEKKSPGWNKDDDARLVF